MSPWSGQNYAAECARKRRQISATTGKNLDCSARLEMFGQAKGDAVPMFVIHRRTQVLGCATVAILSAALMTATYAALIPAGPNYFETVPTGTSIDFSRANISRGFFLLGVHPIARRPGRPDGPWYDRHDHAAISGHKYLPE